jgi:hypothetical protein
MGACVTNDRHHLSNPLDRLRRVRVECGREKGGVSSCKVALITKEIHQPEPIAQKLRIRKQSA